MSKEKELELENKALKEELLALKVDNEAKAEWEAFKLKRDSSEMTAYLDEEVVIDGKGYKEFTFRRPKGKDIKKIGSHAGLNANYQLARILCPTLEAVSNEEFDELDYGNVLKYINEVVEGFVQ